MADREKTPPPSQHPGEGATEALSSALRQRLERLEAHVREVNARRAAEAAQAVAAPQREEGAGQDLVSELKKPGGTPSLALVRRAEDRLVEQEQLGLFDSYRLRPGNEFPTLLARLPIFPAVARARQKPLLDADNAYPFKTPFGKGRRHGPPVTVEEEDHLIALIRLRQKALIGEGARFPIPITDQRHFVDTRGNVAVHVVVCTVSQILEEMGLTDSGTNYRRSMQCLKRVAAISIELETEKSDRYFGTEKKGTTFRLVDIVWQAFETQGLIMAQFPPLVANWLENHATYIQWGVRRQLTGRNARALHRFLSTQPPHYEAPMLWLAESIGWEGDKRRMRTGFEAVLRQLVTLGWLRKFEVTGTGRKIPYRIATWRPR